MNLSDRLRSARQPPRCELCGRPNPNVDDGYTTCCNELEVYPGDPEYESARREWEGIEEPKEDLPKKGDVVFIEKSPMRFLVVKDDPEKGIPLAKLYAGQLTGIGKLAKSQDKIKKQIGTDQFYPRKNPKYGPTTPNTIKSKGKKFVISLLQVVSTYPVRRHDVWVRQTFVGPKFLKLK